MTLDDIEVEELELYLNGDSKQVSDAARELLGTLEVIRGLLYRNKNQAYIVRLLKEAPYNLSDYMARQRYAEAINFYYVEDNVSKAAWRNLHAEKLERAAEFVLMAAKKIEDFKVYKDLMRQAAEMRGLFDPIPQELPKHLFERQWKVYTLDATQVEGIPVTDRRELARIIDDLDITESHKERLRQESMVEKPQLRLNDGAQED